MKHIIDISYYQNPKHINYDKLAKNIDGVILRAGYTGYGNGKTPAKDTAFERHYKEFKKRGVPIGTYWFSCANTKEKGKQEAKNCINVIKGKTFELPIYIDSEMDGGNRGWILKNGKNGTTDAAIGFCEEMERQGYFTGVYASASWFKNRMQLYRLKPYTLWVAHYGLSTKAGKDRYLANGKYDMWQYTSKTRIGGYPGNLDANYCSKNFEGIIKKAGLNGFKKGSKQPKKKEKTIHQLAQEVIAGKHGNGNARKKSLGNKYDKVQAEVNRILKGKNQRKYYTVKPNDSWWKIAEEQWGDGNKMFELARLNGTSVHYTIKPGDRIRIK